jgi:hypothetical protein
MQLESSNNNFNLAVMPTDTRMLELSSESLKHSGFSVFKVHIMTSKQDRFQALSSRFIVKDMGYKTPCWVWQGGQTDRGYGGCWDGERNTRFHVFTYVYLRGPVPDGLELDHLCRVRLCGNPDHLEAVTHQENIRRGQTGIVNRSKTHCKYGHEFTPENTRPTAKGRACRQCSRDWYNTNLKSTNPDLKYWGRKLSVDQIHEFWQLRQSGWKLQRLADHFGVGKSTAHRILIGKNYVGVMA